MNTAVVRKKSPRAPSIPLDEAIERALKVYDKQGRHPGPTDLVARHMGYSGAKNGTALGVLASLRYYGLLIRPSDGTLAVSRDLEAYKFAPSDQEKRSILRKWVNSPSVFAELIEKYKELGLPADANIKYDLIQMEFTSAAADTCVAVFRRSVEFAKALDQISDDTGLTEGTNTVAELKGDDEGASFSQPETRQAVPEAKSSGHDRIPVRLTGGRKAWLEIPIPFFESDKQRLIAQINLLLTDNEDANVADD
jgi:hypothetical protein